MVRGVRLQRQVLEIGLLAASSLRLCAALVALGTPEHTGAAASLALLTLLSLLSESWSKPQGPGTRYAVRTADSDGVSQGTLAVPSVLAALLAADPGDSWLPWFYASCAAAVTTLQHLRRQVGPEGSSGGSGSSGSGGGGSNGSGSAAAAAPAANGHKAAAAAPAGVCVQAHACSGGSRPCGALACGWRHRAATAVHAATAAAVAWFAASAFRSGSGTGWRGGDSGQWPGPGLAGSFVVAAAIAAPPLYGRLLTLLPHTLSLGEASLLTQGILLAAAHGAAALPWLPEFAAAAGAALCGGRCSGGGGDRGGGGGGGGGGQFPGGEGLLDSGWFSALREFGPPWAGVAPASGPLPPEALLSPFVGLLVASVLAAVAAMRLAAAARAERAPARRAAWGAAAAAFAAPAAAVTALLAAWTLAVFLPAAPGRLGVIAYWMGVLGSSLPLMHVAAARRAAPQIILRKGYHLIAVALFLPAFFWDTPLLAAALAIAFAVLGAAEAARVTRLPLVGAAVQSFMGAFVDGRDVGPIYVTHFTLLLGLALPVWLAASLPCGGGGGGGGGGAAPWWARGPAGCGAAAVPAVLAGLSGTMVIGFGDTAASVVGRLAGRTPIHAGARKTAEGTAAGVAATLAGWGAALAGAARAGGVAAPGPARWALLAAATCGACLLEACTSQLDNILIPLWYFPHCLLC
ncbi:hypothetical protein Rsub_08841 [Raphidocelis subcapitata]|uniref:dolichol kinase n=1 Tax=Raphidocelis subcapitata TaxID=307507 RepID=A0A2V0P857_9CHLO|nr:hypothetical protein Rsub_08841 [Raphidocelis subcapitata]|eukprot:GBF96026.1 hypothetical protein Rsub_08841 [Raphidocelis subcapitata]